MCGLAWVARGAGAARALRLPSVRPEINGWLRRRSSCTRSCVRPRLPNNNVAKGCYRIAQIQRVFQQAASAAIAAANAAVDVASVAGSRDEPEA